jgi:hypothetical protein
VKANATLKVGERDPSRDVRTVAVACVPKIVVTVNDQPFEAKHLWTSVRKSANALMLFAVSEDLHVLVVRLDGSKDHLYDAALRADLRSQLSMEPREIVVTLVDAGVSAKDRIESFFVTDDGGPSGVYLAGPLAPDFGDNYLGAARFAVR